MATDPVILGCLKDIEEGYLFGAFVLADRLEEIADSDPANWLEWQLDQMRKNLQTWKDQVLETLADTVDDTESWPRSQRLARDHDQLRAFTLTLFGRSPRRICLQHGPLMAERNMSLVEQMLSLTPGIITKESQS